MSDTTFIVVHYHGEPSKRAFWVQGPYETRALAFDDLASVVRDLIDDGDVSADELDATAEEIARTGDSSSFGFSIHLAHGVLLRITEE